MADLVKHEVVPDVPKQTMYFYTAILNPQGVGNALNSIAAANPAVEWSIENITNFDTTLFVCVKSPVPLVLHRSIMWSK